jgi:hydroxyacylglutathione hydrolase
VGQIGAIVQTSDGIWRVTTSTFESNTYICGTRAPGECFLIDPGLDAERLEVALAELNLRPRYAFCTHGHFDHIGSAAVFQRKYGTQVFLHKSDLATAKGSNFLLMAFKVQQRIIIPEFDLVANDDFSMMIDEIPLRFHSTPGHTPGSCMIRFGDAVFTGDTLYSRGMGLSKLPGEDMDCLRASLRAIWNLFPPEAVAYPGHGDSASFGWIKQNNQKLLQFVGPIDRPQHEVPK